MMKRKKVKNTSFRPWQAVEKSPLPLFPTALSLDKLVTCIEFQYHFFPRGSFSWMACINYRIMNIMGTVMMNEGYKNTAAILIYTRPADARNRPPPHTVAFLMIYLPCIAERINHRQNLPTAETHFSHLKQEFLVQIIHTPATIL